MERLCSLISSSDIIGKCYCYADGIYIYIYILTNCKKIFHIKNEAEKFILSWNLLILSFNEAEYEYILEHIYFS